MILKNDFIRRLYIKLSRYLLGRKYLRVMDGPLKGYLWSTKNSYEYLLGNYEDDDTVNDFKSWLNPGVVVYDIGANAGYYSLLANRYLVNGTIYSFEPLPKARADFEMHLDLNKKKLNAETEIKIFPLAVSDRSKTVQFSNDAARSDGNTYIHQSVVFSGADNKITVQCRSVDEMITAGFLKPDILKIDAEGAEYDVLVGAQNILIQHKPKILLATHDYHLPGVRENCLKFLQQLGYELQHTGNHNKKLSGLDDYIAIHPDNKI